MHFNGRVWAKRASCVFHRCFLSVAVTVAIHMNVSLPLVSFCSVLCTFSIYFIASVAIKCNNNRSRNEICINLFSIGDGGSFAGARCSHCN